MHCIVEDDRSIVLVTMSELVSVQSDSPRADPRTMIIWPDADITPWLCLLLADCTFMVNKKPS